MKNLKIYCVTNKKIDFVSKSNYFFGWVGKELAPKDYLTCNTQDNIFIKEKFYSELTFHYWYWKNQLKNENDTDWIGFCQKRRFWIKDEAKEKNINTNNANDFLVDEVEELPKNVESIICEPIKVNNVKKIKMIKRGIKSLIKDPSIFFDTSKQSVKFHFDMHHGYKNLERAISVMKEKDRSEFLHYVENNVCYNPHIMVISKKRILNKWFSSLFEWLFECENVHGFDKLKGYDTQRLYAFLGERYLSYWFKKYTVYKENHWRLIE
ncbi:DUF4422 domain-containing protein [Candidatus Pelagibacter sp.]|nr:DUF4422 domain-containing protein [Candidatus Pelagibacter sp.]